MLGTKVSHYRIERELGKGGMGTVFLAHDEQLQRKVALKLLSGNVANHSEGWTRILAEGRAAARLNHPSITTVYEVGEDGDHVYIVMELVSGKTLREFSISNALDIRGVVRFASQMADALTIAHEAGIVHGDIKPENVMVQPEGSIKLLDFGIAQKSAAEALTISQSVTNVDWVPASKIAGTIAYMAPEKFNGDKGDSRSDLFSLGVMLYEMAAGRLPFPGPTGIAYAEQIVHENPVPLKANNLPSELVRIVDKLLEKNPQSRYQSTRDLLIDLNNLIRDLDLGAAQQPELDDRKAVAVLPFRLLTPNAEDEYLGVAFADPVISRLGTDPKFLVRPISTVMRYTKQIADPIVAGRELNVQVVVDGSIQKFGNQLRVHWQAWSVADRSTLVSAKHDSEMAKIFQLQDEIADRLAQALGSKQRSDPPSEAPTENPAAYELFLRAVDKLSRHNRWDTLSAIEMLEQAVASDPKFADAWARLAEAQILMGAAYEPRPKYMARAELAVRRALAIDSENSEAHCAQARIIWTPVKKFQHRAALRSLSKALQLNPGSQQALNWQGCICFHIGLLPEAKESLAAALAINPDDTFTLVFLGQVLMYEQRPGDAREYYERALSLDRGNLWANLFAPTVFLYSNELKKTEEIIRRGAQALPDDPMLEACEALMWAKRGEKRKAHQFINKALCGRRSLLHTHHMVHLVAATHAVLDEPVAAVKQLRMASANGLPAYPTFRDDQHFEKLHNNADFLALMHDLKKGWHLYQREFGRKVGAKQTAGLVARTHSNR